MEKIKVTWKNCIKCRHHKIIHDPDPLDWYCRDDLAILCKLTPNSEQDVTSVYASERQEYRPVTKSCRPYDVDRAALIPDWCPLL